MHVFKNLKIQRIRREVNICSILESKRVWNWYLASSISFHEFNKKIRIYNSSSVRFLYNV